jgi:hypothetical protein
MALLIFTGRFNRNKKGDRFILTRQKNLKNKSVTFMVLERQANLENLLSNNE